MFAPLTKPNLGKRGEGARIYLRPACFIDRPHELDDGCLRIADGACYTPVRSKLGVYSSLALLFCCM